MPSILADEKYLEKREKIYGLYAKIDPNSPYEGQAARIIEEWSEDRISYEDAIMELESLVKREEQRIRARSGLMREQYEST